MNPVTEHKVAGLEKITLQPHYEPHYKPHYKPHYEPLSSDIRFHSHIKIVLFLKLCLKCICPNMMRSLFCSKTCLLSQIASLAYMSLRFLSEIGFEKNASIPDTKAIDYIDSSWYALTHAMKGYVYPAYLYSWRMILTVVGPSC